ASAWMFLCERRSWSGAGASGVGLDVSLREALVERRWRERRRLGRLATRGTRGAALARAAWAWTPGYARHSWSGAGASGVGLDAWLREALVERRWRERRGLGRLAMRALVERRWRERRRLGRLAREAIVSGAGASGVGLDVWLREALVGALARAASARTPGY